METRDNSGVLFRNDKQGVDKRPDYTGTCIINGVEMRISAWVKTSQKGNNFLSLAFSEQRTEQGNTQGQAPAPQAAPTHQAPQAGSGSSNSDLPF